MDFLVSKKRQFFLPTLQLMHLEHPDAFFFSGNLFSLSDTRTGSFMSFIKKRNFP